MYDAIASGDLHTSTEPLRFSEHLSTLSVLQFALSCPPTFFLADILIRLNKVTFKFEPAVRAIAH
jgi:hypothetical protein